MIYLLTLWGKLFKDGKIIAADTYTSKKSEMSEALLDCIEHFAKAFDMEAPMWQSTHTKQLGLFRKATFKADDFIDSIPFDRFEIQILEEEN